jgi:hypothetical protein
MVNDAAEKLCKPTILEIPEHGLKIALRGSEIENGT